MHGSTEDDFCLIHRGTKVRKCHTSRRDTFQTVNDIPIGMVKGKDLKLFRDDYNRAKRKGRVKLDAKFEPLVALVKVFPGMRADIIEGLLDAGYKGIVLEGTGLGHAPKSIFRGIKRAIEQGVPIVMTSQCLWGRVNMRVYSTGRDLLRLGVIQGEDILPETAYVKLMFILGHTSELDEVSRLMRMNLAGEITKITRLGTFPKSSLPR
jgi:glutamyl-tRNA(Gln) amidotransferase subunit D